MSTKIHLNIDDETRTAIHQAAQHIGVYLAMSFHELDHWLDCPSPADMERAATPPRVDTGRLRRNRTIKRVSPYVRTNRRGNN